MRRLVPIMLATHHADNRAILFIPSSLRQLCTMRTLYFSVVGSVLNYGILTWGFAHSRLTKIQKRVLQNIPCSKYNAHTEHLFKALDILKLEDNMKLNTLKLYFKYTHETLPHFFASFDLSTQGTHHSHDTRQ